MPKKVPGLKDTAVRNARPRERPYKLFDGGGLFLLVMPGGAKRWRLKYRHGGKEKLLAMGEYPAVTLAEARARAAQARKLIADGLDPSARRQAEKKAQREAEEADRHTFKAVALEWYRRKRDAWAPATTRKVSEALTIDLIPALGSRRIADLTAAEVIAALQAIEARSPHMAHKARQYAGAIVRYAIRTGRREEGRLLDLRDTLKPLRESHFATFTAKDIPAFFEALREYPGTPQTRIAIRLLLLTFVRPSELVGARWEEFDLDACEWRIPAHRMKMKDAHIAPLSWQAVEAIEELRRLPAVESPFLFPSVSRPETKPMHRDTLSKALRTMGYQGVATPHGFRAFASTMLNERGFHPDWIERQLAHKERNKIRAAYNRAQYLAERRRMMQSWADYLDGLKSGADVVPLRAGRER